MLVARRLHESVETPQRAADPPRPVGYLRNDHRRHDRTRVGFGFRRRNGGLDQAHGIDATGLGYDAFRYVEEHDDGYHPRERIVAAGVEMAGLDLFDHNPGGELLTRVVANLLHLLCDGGNALAQTLAARGVECTR